MTRLSGNTQLQAFALCEAGTRAPRAEEIF
jgi:hypothetical protein